MRGARAVKRATRSRLFAAQALIAVVLTGALALRPTGDDQTVAAEPPPVEVLGAVETRPPSTTIAPTTAAPTTAAPAITAAPTTAAPAITAAPTTPVPTTAPPPEGTSRASQIGNQALERIGYEWRANLSEWSLVFEGGREGLRGLTMPDRKRIEIYVRSEDTVAFVARVIAHELGHALDIELNSDADRDRWRVARQLADGVPWWPDGSSFDFGTGAGDFAEAFAVWQTGVSSRSTVGVPLDPDHLALVRELVS